MSWDGLQGAGVSRSASAVESSRFGLALGRVTVGLAVVENGPVVLDDVRADLARVLSEADEDVLVVRYPAAGLGLAAALPASGRDVLPAGTLVYWGARRQDVQPPPGDPALSVLRLSEMSLSEVGRSALVNELVGESFEAYGNHYRANPLLAESAAHAGYQDWARRTATDDPDDALVLVHDARPVGLATVLEGKEPAGHLEVLLAGLRPAAQGQGWYGTLLAGAAGVAADRGRASLVISTQAHNVRVQRAWAKAGLRPKAAVETVHAVRRGLLPV